MLTGPHFSPANLAQVRARIAQAAERAGRSPGSVTLVAVSKDQPLNMLVEARAAGVTDFGENYLQEARAKMAALPRSGLTWHFIGQLQANKTRAVAEEFDWVHTLDRERIAARLSLQRPAHAPPLNVCLQVLLEPEPGKGGVAPEGLAVLAASVAQLPRLRLRGLMCVPPPSADEPVNRTRFARLRGLLEELNAAGHRLDALSMGMSGDFEAALAAGSTMLRLGQVLFGPRPA